MASSRHPEQTIPGGATPLRILVVGINYAPDLLGIAKYTAELAESLASRGHDVEVVTAPPYYPDWKIRRPYKAWRYSSETRRGVRLRRTPIYVPAKPSGLRRLLHHLSFATSSSIPTIMRAMMWRPHIVFAVSPSLMAAPTAVIAARLCGARSWLHVQDFEVDAAFDLGLLRGRRSKRVLLAAERQILRMFDIVSTISPQMCRRLLLKGVDRDKVFEARNWVDTAVVTPQDRMTSFRTALGIGADKTVALYSGNMAAKQGLECLDAAARWLSERRQDIIVVLCGSGPMRAALEASTSGCANVRFLDLQPMGKLSELLSTADIHLLPQRAEAADSVLPSKMSGMLASGRPIVAMAAVGTGLHDEMKPVGITVEPGDGDAFGAAIASLADDGETRERMGRAARDSAMTRWDKDAILDQVETGMIRLANGAALR